MPVTGVRAIWKAKKLCIVLDGGGPNLLFLSRHCRPCIVVTRVNYTLPGVSFYSRVYNPMSAHIKVNRLCSVELLEMAAERAHRTDRIFECHKVM